MELVHFALQNKGFSAMCSEKAVTVDPSEIPGKIGCKDNVGPVLAKVPGRESLLHDFVHRDSEQERRGIRERIAQLPAMGSVPPPEDPKRRRATGMDMGSGDQGTDG